LFKLLDRSAPDMGSALPYLGSRNVETKLRESKIIVLYGRRPEHVERPLVLGKQMRCTAGIFLDTDVRTLGFVWVLSQTSSRKSAASTLTPRVLQCATKDPGPYHAHANRAPGFGDGRTRDATHTGADNSAPRTGCVFRR
jgi:hypothetical protein